MKHAVIFAHPNKSSFTAAVAAAYGAAAEALGHSVLRRDLYGMNFEPRLQFDELPFSKSFRPGEDVIAERELLRDADVFALVYPLWLDAPPAILKGYMDRVFGYGFAYTRDAKPLLNGKKLIVFTSSGAPLGWIQQTGDLQALKALFDRNFAAICGLEFVDHFHAGGMVPGIREDVIKSRLEHVGERVKEFFGGRG